MQDKMNIPSKIKVGFQNRSDTYTGKLAYIVYIDEKGVLRKEKSWEGWRDKRIDPQEFNNEPTSGFVLNKKVGDYRSSWNHRTAKIRIYDPRGFEFEIPVENLLYILEECTSTKGKGLEGDFVYAWSDKDLVLLPTTSQEYKSSSDFTSLKTMKVTKADMIEGCIYLAKNTDRLLYLGYDEVFETNHHFYNKDKIGQYSIGKKRVFLKVDDNTDKPSYVFLDGFTKLAKRETDTISSAYADAYDNFKKSSYASCSNKVVFVPGKPFTKDEQYSHHPSYWYYNCNRVFKYKENYYYLTEYPKAQFKGWSHSVHDITGYIIASNKLAIENGSVTRSKDSEKISVSQIELDALETFTIELENQFGTRKNLI